MSQDHRHSVSVAGVVIDNQGRALLTRRRDNGRWEPPGGVLEHGETIDDGLRREVFEETGLKIEPRKLTGIYQNMSRNIVALVFRCQAIGGQLATNAEVSEFQWATDEDTHDLMTEAYAVRVQDALDPSDSTAIRWHDGTNLL